MPAILVGSDGFGTLGVFPTFILDEGGKDGVSAAGGVWEN
jgi:hypothetical protein